MVIDVKNKGSQYYFSKNIEDITISEVDFEKLTVKIYKNNYLNLISEEVYYPDADRNISITGLSEFFENHIEDKKIDEVTDTNTEPYDLFILRFFNGESLLDTEYLGVKYCSARTPFSGSADFAAMILSRHRNFTILPYQRLRFSVLFNFVPAYFKLVLSATFRKEHNVGFHRVEIDLHAASSTYFQRNYNLSVADVVNILHEHGCDDVTESNLSSVVFAYAGKVDKKVHDAVSFKIDRRARTNVTTFLFMNMYHVPEAVNFYGREKEEVEGAPEFGQINREYVRLNDTQTNVHTAYSGFISLIDYKSIVDLTNSTYVYKEDKDGTENRITVIDYELSRTLNASAPISVYIKYRMSEVNQITYDVESNEEFMNLFDETYTEVYE